MKRIICYRCKQPYENGSCGCRDGQTVVWGDCREVLPLLEAGSVDLVLTDPPYGINDTPLFTPDLRKAKRRGGNNTYHPESTWDKKLPIEEARLCGRFGIVVWFGHWKNREPIANAIGLPIRCEIIWVKDTHVGPPCPAAMQDERMWVFSQNGLKPRCFETTVWHEPIIPTWSYRHHRNEKPLALMKRALRWLPGEIVLDPFCGSGTTLRATKDLGRRCIGIEIEQKYCDIIVGRLGFKKKGVVGKNEAGGFDF